MPLPNFIVIGAGRAGTTTLHHRLGQHPQIFMTAEKSPNFFLHHDAIPLGEVPAVREMARHWVSTRVAYEALFDAVTDELAVGEVSPVYLQTKHSPVLIKELCPGVKIVAILRHPVERAYAHFLGRRRDGLENRDDFARVTEAELAHPFPDDIAFGHYLGCGRYHHFLETFYALFARERIEIYLYEDFIASPRTLMADLFEFLGVDPTFVPSDTHRNRSGYIASPVARWLRVRSVRLRTWLRPHLPLAARDKVFDTFSKTLIKPPLDAQLRARLTSHFTHDIDRLEQLIGRDLSR